MKTKTIVSGRFQSSPFESTSKSLSDVFRCFNSVQIANTLGDRIQSVTLHEMQLGNELSFYNPSLSNETHIDDRPSTSDYYLICEGRIRLLCQNVRLQRQVSADLLEAGAGFGADHLFSAMPLPYRAVAASPCRIVQISHQQLTVQLEQLPQLRKALNQTVQQRERLIFFKRFTQQRSIPSHTLKYVLLPQLTEYRIEAGTYLSQSLTSTGYFWLRTGQILNPSNPEISPKIGDGWGYPDAVPEEWVAQTDLILYSLPLDLWKTLDLLRL